MKDYRALCIALLDVLAAPTALAAKPVAISPYAVVAHTVDWRCAQNTSQMAQVPLTNAGLIDQTKVDNSKTEIRLLLKKSFGHQRYEYIYHMVLHQTDGKSISIITESTAEDVECPSQDVKVYVVSREFGHSPSLDWIPPDDGAAKH